MNQPNPPQESPKPKKKQLMSFHDHQAMLLPYKRSIRNGTILFGICIGLLILERFFTEPISEQEVNALIALQSAFGLSRTSWRLPFYLLCNIQEQQVFLLLSMHVVSVVFFRYDQILALKSMASLYITWYILTFLELLYHSPQPFWRSSEIITYMCDQKFGSPADATLLLLMFIATLMSNQNKKNIIIASIVMVIYSFLVYLSGQVFIIDLVLGLVYFVMLFSVAVAFNESITNYIANRQQNKMFPFQVLFAASVMLLVLLLFYVLSDNTDDVTWVQNFFVCYQDQPNLGNFHQYKFNTILGAEPTFSQCTILVCMVVMASINLPNRKANTLQLLIIQAGFIPAWLIIVLQGSLTQVDIIRSIGFSQVLLDAIVFGVLHWWIFGYLGRKMTQVVIEDYQQLGE